MKKIIKKTLYLLFTISVFASIIMDINVVSTYAETSKDYISNIVLSEEKYSENMKSIVEPYLNNIVSSGDFEGQNNATLYYEKYIVENNKGNIVINHGFTENLTRYRELIYYFTKSGYNVYAFEARGHGRSTNLGIMDDSQINVENFDYYVQDLKTFMDEIVNPAIGGEKVYLFAHSMGGGIGAVFLEKYQEYFDAAILNSPMLEVNTGSVPALIAKGIAKGAVIFGKGDEYVAGQGPYSGEYDFSGTGTSCEERYSYFYNIDINNEAFQKGGASYRWLNEAFEATDNAIKKKNASKVSIPIILFQAGQDTFVKPGGQNKFAEYAQNCELIKIDNAKHEIYREKNEILVPYLGDIFEFLENN